MGPSLNMSLHQSQLEATPTIPCMPQLQVFMSGTDVLSQRNEDSGKPSALIKPYKYWHPLELEPE